MLETSGVSRVTSNRNVYIFLPHNSNTFANVVSTIAVYLSTRTIAVSCFLNNLEFASVVVELSLYVSKTIDTADNHSSVLTKTVEDATERFVSRTALVSHLSNLDSTFSSCKTFVTSEEGEALSLRREQTCCKATVTDTNLTIVSYRTRDAECLKTFANVLSSFNSVLSLFLQCDSSTYNVSPLSVLKADHLCAFALHVRINAVRFANLVSLFNIFDAVLIKSSENLLHATVLAFKLYFSNHFCVPP